MVPFLETLNRGCRETAVMSVFKKAHTKNKRKRGEAMDRGNSKITNTHLAKDAIVYIRQSSPRQVLENNESTMRQYGLRQKLIDLGWPPDRVRVIDQDLGKSGAGSKDRDGFRSLVADVSNGLVGAVACIECSRLSRDSEDWIKLM